MTLIPGSTRVSCFERLHALANRAAEVPPRPVKRPLLPYRLTQREMEVVRVLDRCVYMVEIAAELGCDRGTVKRHLGSIYAKTGTNNFRGLLTLAIRKGLVSIEVEDRPSWMVRGQRLPE